MSVSHEEVVKAAQAEQILESDVFKEAIENLKNEYVTHWLNLRNIDDIKAREDIHRSILLLPEVERLWLAYQKDYPIVKSQLKLIRPLAASAGKTLVELPVNNLKELETQLNEHTGPFDADVIIAIAEPLMVTPEAFTIVGRFAAEHSIPICSSPFFEGEYQSIYTLIPEASPQGRKAALLADKIFKGSPAGKIPVITADYLFLLNYKEALKQGIKVSEHLLNQADQIIR